MRIALFTNTYYPTINGVAHCVHFYAQGLTAAGHETVIFAPCPEGYDPPDDPDGVVRFPSLTAPNDVNYHIALPFSRDAAKMLRKTRFDIVHTQHPMWVGSWGQAYARWAKLPLVTTVHTDYELFSHAMPLLPEALVDTYLRFQVTSYCNRCDVVTCAVESTRKRLLKRGITTPIEILSNPTDLAKFARAQGSAVRSRYGIGGEEIVVGYVGRLSEEKNLRFLLEVVAVVLNAEPSARFLCVGGGPEANVLERIARKLGIAERTIFTGNIEHDEVGAYQAALDVFVTASLSETQPLAYTEAMACRKPLVALRAPGAEDMIIHGSTGVLIEQSADVAGMAEAVLALVHDKAERERLGRNAHKAALRFDVKHVTQRLLEVYDQAVQRHQSAQ